MSKQIKIASYSLSKQKSYRLTSGRKSMYSVLDNLILYSLLVFLQQGIRDGYILWKTQPEDELKDKGHDENHSQSKYSIFH